MVDGSNESLYYADEELDPILQKGIPLLKTFQKRTYIPISYEWSNDPLTEENPQPIFLRLCDHNVILKVIQ